jgi:hypothetical protein
VRHRQPKGAATDMFDLPPLRHISTLRVSLIPMCPGEGRLTELTTVVQPWQREPLFVPHTRPPSPAPRSSELVKADLRIGCALFS